MMRARYLLPLLALSALANACTDPDPATKVGELRDRSVALTTDMVRDVGQSLEFLDSLDSFDSVLEGLEPMFAMIDRVSGTEEVPPEPYPQVEEEETVVDVANDAADELGRVLEEYVFADANLESQDGNKAVFLIRASVVCPKLRDEQRADCASIDWGCAEYPYDDCAQYQQEDRAACTASADDDLTSCMEQLDAMKLRVAVTALEDGGMDASILVGPAKVNPFDLHLAEGDIAVEADLEGITASLEHINSVVGEEADLGLPEELSGAFRASLKKNGEQDFTAALAITQPLVIRGTFEESGDYTCTYDVDGYETCEEGEPIVRHIDLQSGIASSLFSVRAQGLERKLTSAIGLGPTMLILPFAELFDIGNPTGNLVVTLSGLTGEVVVAEGVEALVLNGLGLGNGDSSVRHDSTPLVTVSLNASAGRAFGQVTTLVDGWPMFDFDPGVEAKITLNLEALDPYVEEPAAAFLRDQTYTVKLAADDAGAATVTPFAATSETSVNGDGLQVVAGALSFATSADAAATVTVDAGMCLFGVSEPAVGAHELLGYFYAATCE